MTGFSADLFTATLALVAAVVIVAALLSGVVERSGLPQVAVFLALGAALGPSGLYLLNIPLDSPVLRVVATLGLVLVLFTDAVTIDIAWIRRHAALALRVLGPGALLSAAVIGVSAWLLLGVSPAAAAVLGAALASTDPVLLRGLLRRRGLPGGAREALRLETGLNDGVLLPIVLVAMAFMSQAQGEAAGHGVAAAGAGGAAVWGRLGLDLLLLGPGAGVGVGLLSVAALDLVRRRIGIRRDYESLYSLGVALAAYAAAEAVHGSGFVAAFVAGLTISYLDVELCECFLEYGETTAEMALLFAFVLFGSSLIWTGFTVLDGPTLAFAAVALLARPAVFYISLLGSSLDTRSRLLVAWFGPRGLSSLLLVLLPIFAGLDGNENLFAVCSLVVLLSVLLHGGAAMLPIWEPSHQSSNAGNVAGRVPQAPELEQEPVGQLPAGHVPELGQVPVGHMPARRVPELEREAAGPALEEQVLVGRVAAAPEVAAAPAPERLKPAGVESDDGLRASLDEVRCWLAAGTPVVLLDVRTERTYERGTRQVAGAARLPPDHVVERATALGLPHDAWLVAYCA